MTGEDGLLKVGVYFNGPVTYSIYAEKDGYTTSCRAVTIGSKEELANKGRVDLGMGKVLEKGSTRAVLSWNTWTGANSANDKDEFDLDLWATFG